MEDWLGERARTDGESLALTSVEGALSYAELDARVERAARRLAAAGVRPADRVAVALAPGPAWVELFHAVPRLGAVLVPLNTRLTRGERRWQVRDAAPRLVVQEPLEGGEAALPPRSPARPTDPHTLLYTSGTSARPRGVVLTRGNHGASARGAGQRLGLGASDRWLGVLPLFHVGGLAVLARAVLHGSSVERQPDWDEGRVLTALGGGRITRVSLVATMLRRLLEAGLQKAPGLRAALVGGGPVPRDLLDRAVERGLPVLQTYGLTETASMVATLTAREALEARGSAGRPLAGVELRIGKGGEILVRGPMVSPRALAADGWLHTGDAGRLDADGLLWVDGRLGDTIVTGGENVSPSEVEEVLLAHPAVADAGVAGRPHREWGEAVTAWVVTQGKGVGESELVAHCRARLAGYKVPRTVHVVQRLPRNAAGKLLRRAL